LSVENGLEEKEKLDERAVAVERPTFLKNSPKLEADSTEANLPSSPLIIAEPVLDNKPEGKSKVGAKPPDSKEDLPQTVSDPAARELASAADPLKSNQRPLLDNAVDSREGEEPSDPIPGPKASVTENRDEGNTSSMPQAGTSGGLFSNIRNYLTGFTGTGSNSNVSSIESTPNASPQSTSSEAPSIPPTSNILESNGTPSEKPATNSSMAKEDEAPPVKEIKPSLLKLIERISSLPSSTRHLSDPVPENESVHSTAFLKPPIYFRATQIRLKEPFRTLADSVLEDLPLYNPSSSGKRLSLINHYNAQIRIHKPKGISEHDMLRIWNATLEIKSMSSEQLNQNTLRRSAKITLGKAFEALEFRKLEKEKKEEQEMLATNREEIIVSEILSGKENVWYPLTEQLKQNQKGKKVSEGATNADESKGKRVVIKSDDKDLDAKPVDKNMLDKQQLEPSSPGEVPPLSSVSNIETESNPAEKENAQEGNLSAKLETPRSGSEIAQPKHSNPPQESSGSDHRPPSIPTPPPESTAVPNASFLPIREPPSIRQSV
jgi:hypothetical protein